MSPMAKCEMMHHALLRLRGLCSKLYCIEAITIYLGIGVGKSRPSRPIWKDETDRVKKQMAHMIGWLLV